MSPAGLPPGAASPHEPGPSLGGVVREAEKPIPLPEGGEVGNLTRVSDLTQVRRVFGIVDDSIVANARRQPVGLVDSRNVPKLKIM